MEKVRENVLQYEATTDPDHDSTLVEIMHLVEMGLGASDMGWHRESARLYAIDVAMTVIRRNTGAIPETERQHLSARLHEARTLVVGDRDAELGFIQTALETHMATAGSSRERRVWLAAIDALVPSPYRAALISTRNALSLGAMGTFNDVAALLRDRLIARLDEGSLTAEPPPSFYLSA